MTDLIKTAVKNKLGRGFSYPLGAEQISKQLNGIPQFNEIVLCFYSSLGTRIYYFAPDSVAGTRLKGVAKQDSKLYDFRTVLIGRWWDDSWSIAVHKVKSNVRNNIKQALIKCALSELKGWLSKDYQQIWFSGKRRLHIGISENSDEISVCKLHNAYLLDVKYIKVPNQTTNG